MILNSAPADQAIVSNVGEIGEFRIRNSAKAFSILSSGLYGNKIKAIVRELSCNAYDSHVAAGKKDVPFDVHLPSTLEPYFSIRDYGTGLSHDQVTNIYTTYFESTKTHSNDFVGALGLGSKSPFSYTDNFTVTAIRDGRKGIYTAFINDQGVPAIALMAEEFTSEPAGVEVKFGVNERYDFDRFRQEASEVYKHFDLKPVVTGNSDFEFKQNEYESQNIIPGVHVYKDRCGSVAVMGNIAYPIEIPQTDKSLGDLASLLRCGLELHFDIGELDFQASREGLSYVPQTVSAIKSKLAATNAVLVERIAQEADQIENLWKRAEFLLIKHNHALWSSAVIKYAKDTALPTFNTTKYSRIAQFEFKIADLTEKWNIQLRRMQKLQEIKSVSSHKPSTDYANGISYQKWNIHVDPNCHFVISDIKTGAGERVRYHYRTTKSKVYQQDIWLLEKADKSKEMDLKGFFAAIHEPPLDRRFMVSLLEKKLTTRVSRDVSILRLERRGNGSWNRRDDMVWRDAGVSSQFPALNDQGKPLFYYYVPLNGFVMESSYHYSSAKELYEDATCLPDLYKGAIYGVRKKDIEEIKKRKNWINFEQHLATLLNSMVSDNLVKSLALADLEDTFILALPNQGVLELLEYKFGPYAKLINEFKDIKPFKGNRYAVNRFLQRFAVDTKFNMDALKSKYQQMINCANNRYPLLCRLNTYALTVAEIADYVNMCDAAKS